MNKGKKLLVLLGILSLGLLCLAGCGRISIGTGITEKTEEVTTEEVIPGLPEGVWSPDSEKVKENSFEEKKDYVETVQDGTLIHVSPDENGDVYMVLVKGVNMKRTGVNGAWTRVKLNSGSYYVKSSDVTPCTVKWAEEKDVTWINHLIYIDPAKQIAPDPSLEALFPGGDVPEQTYDANGNVISTIQRTSTSKEKMGKSSQGISSGKYEYEITLAAAYSIQAELIRRGYNVILSRSANNVNISNGQRALRAVEEGAELYLRISAGNGSDYSQSGIMGCITTAANEATKAHYQENYTLCSSVLQETVKRTGADNNGIYQTDDITALNFCTMPALSLNIGYLTSEEDDKQLNDSTYLEKMAQGIADGIDLFFEEE